MFRPSFRPRRGAPLGPVALGLLLAPAGAVPAAGSLPSGEQVVHGAADFARSGDGTVLDVRASERVIIDWQDFSVAPGHAANFLHPTPLGASLNRVLGADPSEIGGALTSNGGLYLLNPNGVLVTPTGTVDTAGSFLASTLDLKNSAFLGAAGDPSSAELHFLGSSGAAVVNLGAVTALDGDIFLIARQVENAATGRLLAPRGTVGLAAGNEVQVLIAAPGEPGAGGRILIAPSNLGGAAADADADADVDSPVEAEAEAGSTAVANAGAIKAVTAELKASGNRYALAVNHTGSIAATGVEETPDGRVLLVAGGSSGLTRVDGAVTARDHDGSGGTVHALGDRVGLYDGARIDASAPAGDGGEVLVGGDYQGANPEIPNTRRTYVAPGATIAADALLHGDGGRVIVWSDEVTRFFGAIQATGANGAGGFAEVSSRGHLDFRGGANLAGAHGYSNGHLLLDPTDMTVTTAGTMPANATLVSPFTPTGTPSTVPWAAILAALNTGDVTVSTVGSVDSGAETGAITIEAGAIVNALASGNTLSFNSADTITVSGAITGLLGAFANNLVMSAVNNIAFGAAVDFDVGDVTLTYGSMSGASMITAGKLTASRTGGGTNAWSVTGPDSGTLNGVPFGAPEIVGGANVDTFTMGAGGSISGTINGGDGVDEIVGKNSATDWMITGVAVGSNDQGVTSFLSVEELTGSSAADSFAFTGSSVIAAVDGGGGSDTLVLTGRGDVIVTFDGSSVTEEAIPANIVISDSFSGIEDINANGTSVLRGTAAADTINVTAANAGNVMGGPTFSGFREIAGGDGNDLINVSADITTVRGQNGDDMITVSAGTAGTVGGGANMDTITASGTGTITTANGNDGNDTIRVTAAGATITTANGGNNDDLLVLSGGTITNANGDAGTDRLTVNTATATTYDGGTGAGDNILITANSTTSTYTYTNATDGSVVLDGTTITYTNLAPISNTGSTADAIFNLPAGGNGDVLLSMFAAGRSQLTSANFEDTDFDDPTNTLMINLGAGGDTIEIDYNAGGATMTLTGAGGNDTIDLDVTVTGGTISGAGGTDTLNVAGIAGANVNLQSSTTTGFTGGTFNGIENFVGGGAGFTLTGANAAQTWNITGQNDGNIGGTTPSFTDFANLTGGSAADSFVIAAGGSITGTITGSGGTDQITGKDDATTWTVNVANGGSNDDISAFAGIEILRGSDGAGALGVDTFNVSNTFGLINARGGNDMLNFTGASNVTTAQGGGGGDMFTFTAGAVGTADGQNGPDTFNFNGGTVTDANGGVDVDTYNLGTGGSVTNIDGGTGGTSEDDVINGSNEARTWSINTAGTGTTDEGIGTFANIEHIVGGSMDDIFNVGAAGNMTATAGTEIDGGGGTDALNYNGGGFNVTWTPTTVSSADGRSITYANIDTSTTSSTGGTLNIDGSGGADTIVFNGTGNQAGNVTVGAGPTITFTGVTTLDLDGLGGNDIFRLRSAELFTQTVDVDGGAPTSVVGGDSIELENSTVTNAVFNYTDIDTGDITWDGTTVNYDDVEPLLATTTITLTNVTLNYSTAAETLTVTEPAAGQTRVTSTAGEVTTFTNPSGSFTINAGDTGGDTINVTSLTANYPASITINGQSGTDTLNINGSVSTADDFINFTNNETVDINAGVTAATSLTVQNASTEIDIAPGIDLAANGGNLDLNNTVTQIDFSGSGGMSILSASAQVQLAAVVDSGAGPAEVNVRSGTGMTLAAVTLNGGNNPVLDLDVDSDGGSSDTLTAAGAISAGTVEVTGMGSNETFNFASTVTSTNGGVTVEVADTADFNGDVTAANGLTIQTLNTDVDLAAGVDLVATAGTLSVPASATLINLSGGAGTNVIQATAADVSIGANISDTGTPAILRIRAGTNIAVDAIDIAILLDIDLDIGGDDAATLDANDTVSAGTITVNGQGNNDTMNFDSTVGSTAGAITVTQANIVNLDGDVTAATNLTVQNVNSEIRLGTGVDLTATTGSVDLNNTVNQIDLDGAAAANIITAGANIQLAAVVDDGTPTELELNADDSITLDSVTLNGIANPVLDIDVDEDGGGGTLTANALTAGTVTITGTAGGNDTFNLNGSVTASNMSVTIEVANQVNVANARDITAQTDLTVQNITTEFQLGTNGDLTATTGTVDANNSVNRIDLNGAGGTNTVNAGADVELAQVIDNGTPAELEINADDNITLAAITLNGAAAVILDIDLDEDGAGGTLNADGALQAGQITVDGTGTDDTMNFDMAVESTNTVVTVNQADIVNFDGDVTAQTALTVSNVNSDVDLATGIRLRAEGGDVAINTGIGRIDLDGGAGRVLIDTSGGTGNISLANVEDPTTNDTSLVVFTQIGTSVGAITLESAGQAADLGALALIADGAITTGAVNVDADLDTIIDPDTAAAFSDNTGLLLREIGGGVINVNGALDSDNGAIRVDTNTTFTVDQNFTATRGAGGDGEIQIGETLGAGGNFPSADMTEGPTLTITHSAGNLRSTDDDVNIISDGDYNLSGAGSIGMAGAVTGDGDDGVFLDPVNATIGGMGIDSGGDVFMEASNNFTVSANVRADDRIGLRADSDASGAGDFTHTAGVISSDDDDGDNVGGVLLSGFNVTLDPGGGAAAAGVESLASGTYTGLTPPEAEFGIFIISDNDMVINEELTTFDNVAGLGGHVILQADGDFFRVAANWPVPIDGTAVSPDGTGGITFNNATGATVQGAAITADGGISIHSAEAIVVDQTGLTFDADGTVARTGTAGNDLHTTAGFVAFSAESIDFNAADASTTTIDTTGGSSLVQIQAGFDFAALADGDRRDYGVTNRADNPAATLDLGNTTIIGGAVDVVQTGDILNINDISVTGHIHFESTGTGLNQGDVTVSAGAVLEADDVDTLTAGPTHPTALGIQLDARENLTINDGAILDGDRDDSGTGGNGVHNIGLGASGTMEIDGTVGGDGPTGGSDPTRFDALAVFLGTTADLDDGGADSPPDNILLGVSAAGEQIRAQTTVSADAESPIATGGVEGISLVSFDILSLDGPITLDADDIDDADGTFIMTLDSRIGADEDNDEVGSVTITAQVVTLNSQTTAATGLEIDAGTTLTVTSDTSISIGTATTVLTDLHTDVGELELNANGGALLQNDGTIISDDGDGNLNDDGFIDINVTGGAFTQNAAAGGQAAAGADEDAISGDRVFITATGDVTLNGDDNGGGSNAVHADGTLAGDGIVIESTTGDVNFGGDADIRSAGGGGIDIDAGTALGAGNGPTGGDVNLTGGTGDLVTETSGGDIDIDGRVGDAAGDAVVDAALVVIVIGADVGIDSDGEVNIGQARRVDVVAVVGDSGADTGDLIADEDVRIDAFNDIVLFGGLLIDVTGAGERVDLETTATANSLVGGVPVGITMADGTLISNDAGGAAANTVTLNSFSSVFLSQVEAFGVVTVEADEGEIRDNGDSMHPSAATFADILSTDPATGGAVLTAEDGIGRSIGPLFLNEIDTDVPLLALDNSAGSGGGGGATNAVVVSNSNAGLFTVGTVTPIFNGVAGAAVSGANNDALAEPLLVFNTEDRMEVVDDVTADGFIFLGTGDDAADGAMAVEDDFFLATISATTLAPVRIVSASDAIEISAGDDVDLSAATPANFLGPGMGAVDAALTVTISVDAGNADVGVLPVSGGTVVIGSSGTAPGVGPPGPAIAMANYRMIIDAPGGIFLNGDTESDLFDFRPTNTGPLGFTTGAFTITGSLPGPPPTIPGDPRDTLAVDITNYTNTLIVDVITGPGSGTITSIAAPPEFFDVDYAEIETTIFQTFPGAVVTPVNLGLDADGLAIGNDGTNNEFLVRLDPATSSVFEVYGDNAPLVLAAVGQPLKTIAFDSVLGFILLGATMDSDQLTVDNTFGLAIPGTTPYAAPNLGVTFHGRGEVTGPGDQLIVTDAALLAAPFTSVTFNFRDRVAAFPPIPDLMGGFIAPGLESGEIIFTGPDLTPGGLPDPSDRIFFSELEPVTDTSVAVLKTFNFPNATGDAIILSDDAVAGDGESFINSNNSESVTFLNPLTSGAGAGLGDGTFDLVINGGGGVDTFNIDGLDTTGPGAATSADIDIDVNQNATGGSDLGFATLEFVDAGGTDVVIGSLDLSTRGPITDTGTITINGVAGGYAAILEANQGILVAPLVNDITLDTPTNDFDADNATGTLGDGFASTVNFNGDDVFLFDEDNIILGAGNAGPSAAATGLLTVVAHDVDNTAPGPGPFFFAGAFTVDDINAFNANFLPIDPTAPISVGETTADSDGAAAANGFTLEEAELTTSFDADGLVTVGNGTLTLPVYAAGGVQTGAFTVRELDAGVNTGTAEGYDLTYNGGDITVVPGGTNVGVVLNDNMIMTVNANAGGGASGDVIDTKDGPDFSVGGFFGVLDVNADGTVGAVGLDPLDTQVPRLFVTALGTNTNDRAIDVRNAVGASTTATVTVAAAVAAEFVADSGAAVVRNTGGILSTLAPWSADAFDIDNIPDLNDDAHIIISHDVTADGVAVAGLDSGVAAPFDGDPGVAIDIDIGAASLTGIFRVRNGATIDTSTSASGHVEITVPDLEFEFGTALTAGDADILLQPNTAALTIGLGGREEIDLLVTSTDGAGPNDDQIIRFNGDGTISGTPAFLMGPPLPDDPVDIAFGPDGDLYVADFFGGGGRVLRYDGQTGAFVAAFAVAGMTNPVALTIGLDGHIYVAEAGGDVFAIDAVTGADLGMYLTVPLNNFPDVGETVTSIEFSGSEFYATISDADDVDGRVAQFDAAFATLNSGTFITTFATVQPGDIAFSNDAATIYLTNTNTGNDNVLFSYNATTGALITVLEDTFLGRDARGVTVAPDAGGDIFVASQLLDFVNRWNPLGDIDSAPFAQDALLTDPFDLVFARFEASTGTFNASERDMQALETTGTVTVGTPTADGANTHVMDIGRLDLRQETYNLTLIADVIADGGIPAGSGFISSPDNMTASNTQTAFIARDVRIDDYRNNFDNVAADISGDLLIADQTAFNVQIKPADTFEGAVDPGGVFAIDVVGTFTVLGFGETGAGGLVGFTQVDPINVLGESFIGDPTDENGNGIQTDDDDLFPAQDVLWTNVLNNFGDAANPLNIYARNVTLVNSDALFLREVVMTDTIDLTTVAGNIAEFDDATSFFDGGRFTVFDAAGGAADVIFDNPANDFGILDVTATNIDLAQDPTITLEEVLVADGGRLTVESFRASIVDFERNLSVVSRPPAGGLVTAAGFIDVGSGVESSFRVGVITPGGDIRLVDEDNDFIGAGLVPSTVTFITNEDTGPPTNRGDVLLNTNNDLRFGASTDFGGATTSVEGNFTFQLPEAPGQPAGTLVDGVDISQEDGAITVASPGGIAGSGVLDINTSGDVDLSPFANNFTLIRISVSEEGTDTDGNFISIRQMGTITVQLIDTSSFMGNTSNVTLLSDTGSIVDSTTIRVSGDFLATTSMAGEDIILDDPANEFGGTVDLEVTGAGADVVVAARSAIDLGDVNGSGSPMVFPGDLTVTATGGITQEAGIAITVAGITTLTSGDADILLTEAANDFTGAVRITTGPGGSGSGATNPTLASIRDVNALVFGRSVVRGDLRLESAMGITQEAGVANTEDILVRGDTTLVTAVAPLVLGGGADQDIDLGTLLVTTTDAPVTITENAPMDWGTSSIDGILTATSTEAITNSGGITVSGGSTASFTTTQIHRAITLDHPANAFSGSVDVTTTGVGRVTVVNSVDLDLAGFTVAGPLLVSTGGNLTQSGPVVGADATFSGLIITLGNVGNNFTNLHLTATVADVVESDTVALGNIAVAGDLALTAAAGNVTDGPPLDVGGRLTVTTSAAGADIILDNLFSTVAEFDLNTAGAGGDATVRNTGGVVFGGTSDIGGNLTVSGSSVSQTGAVNAAGTVNVTGNAGGAIDLSNAGNTLGTLVLTGGDISVTEDSAVVFGQTTATGDLVARAVTGTITDAVGARVVADGTASFTADTAGAAITLDTAQNRFGGAVSTSVNAAAVTLTSAVPITLGNSTVVMGDLVINAATGIAQAAGTSISVTGGGTILNAASGNIALTSATNDFGTSLALFGRGVEVVESGALTLATSRVTRSAEITAGGDITQGAGTTLTVLGDAVFNASGNVGLGTLAGTTANFGSIGFNAVSATVEEDSALVLGPSAVAGTVDLTTNTGTITQSGALAAGTLILDSASSANLQNTGNAVLNLGAVTAGGAFTFYDFDGGLNVTGAVAATNGAVNFPVIINSAGGGNLIVSSALGASSNVILATAPGGIFVNSAGAGLFAAATGDWLIYAQNEASVIRNGITEDFIKFVTTFPTPAGRTGNGLLFSDPDPTP